MPGPNGIITLASDPDTTLRAGNKTAALALEAVSEALSAEELYPIEKRDVQEKSHSMRYSARWRIISPKR